MKSPGQFRCVAQNVRSKRELHRTAIYYVSSVHFTDSKKRTTDIQFQFHFVCSVSVFNHLRLPNALQILSEILNKLLQVLSLTKSVV